MLGDISLGRYVPGQSPVHRLDPRTKAVVTLGVAIGVIGGTTLSGTAWHVIITVGVISLASIPGRFVARSMKPFLWLFAIVLISHLLAGGLQSWDTGLALGGRLMTMIAVASLLSWTTPPLSIVNALRWFGKPLARLKLPVDAGATAIGLALRFAPVALDEARTVLRAQAARGADFSGIRNKLALIVPMLGTLFERAFTRADTLADAMESRGYDPNAMRTHYRKLEFGARDLAALIFAAIWIIGGYVIDRSGV